MKTITASILAGIVGALIMLGGVTLTDNKAYYCEATNIVMICDSLGQYYSLDSGKCFNSNVGNKLCRTGWTKIIDEIEFSSPKGIVQYLCNSKECVKI